MCRALCVGMSERVHSGEGAGMEGRIWMIAAGILGTWIGVGLSRWLRHRGRPADPAGELVSIPSGKGGRRWGS